MHRQFRRKTGATRKKDLAAIHIAKAALGMDDETYRALLFRVTRKQSAGDLDDLERGRVLQELKRLQGGATRPNDPTRGKPHNFDRMPEMITKIEALLADMELPWSYADAIAKQQWGIERMAWLRREDCLRAIIAALHVEHEKRCKGQAVDEMLQQLGWTESHIVHIWCVPTGWRRNRKQLASVIQSLQDVIRLKQQGASDKQDGAS